MEPDKDMEKQDKQDDATSTSNNDPLGDAQNSTGKFIGKLEKSLDRLNVYLEKYATYLRLQYMEPLRQIFVFKVNLELYVQSTHQSVL